MVGGVRFAVDRGSIRKGTAPQLRPRQIARFTQYVVNTKAKELLSRYLKAQLEAGLKAEKIDLRPRWFSEWRYE